MPTQMNLTSHALSVLALVVLAASALSCSGTDSVDTPRIVASPAAIAFGSTVLGEEDFRDLLIINRGPGTLRVFDITIDTDTDHISLPAGTETAFELETDQQRILSVLYRPTEPFQTSGSLIFDTNDPQAGSFEVEILTPSPRPIPNVIPAVIDFGVVGVNTEGQLDTIVRNVGFSPLIICDATVTGSPEISSNLAGALQAAVDPGTGLTVLDIYQADTGLGVDELPISLFYRPIAPGADSASLSITYDTVGDINAPCEEGNTETTNYPIDATAGTSVLGRSPCPLDFGESAIDVERTEVVTLSNLGALPLEVFDVRLDPARSGDAFSVDPTGIPAELEAGAATGVAVSYQPNDLTAQSGVMLIDHTDSAGDRVTSECRLSGVGVENDCPIPVPVGWILEDAQNRRGSNIDWALPLQTLVLDATGSYDPSGESIVDYAWEITRAPTTALNGVRPFVGDPGNPALAQYSLSISGNYEFCLTVVDAGGLSCEAACIQVAALPTEAIAIELTWENYTDPDETDEEGSDLDLHFVKMPNAWFDPIYDAYYGNREPIWSPETPSLDRDDTDGAGPETTQMDDPENCQWYAIGVHYFRETYGTAWPRATIYLQNRELAPIIGPPLQEADYFWDVGRLHWPSGTFVLVNDVATEFNSRTSGGVAPPVTDEMRALGLCGTPP